VTVVPLEATDGPPPILCVLCGDGALADGVLNAALFLPLAAALSVAGWRAWRNIALGALLSCGLETAQFVIPGRDPSLPDVLFNTLGTALGVALAHSAPAVWRSTPGRHPLDRRGVGCGVRHHPDRCSAGSIVPRGRVLRRMDRVLVISSGMGAASRPAGVSGNPNVPRPGN